MQKVAAVATLAGLASCAEGISDQNARPRRSSPAADQSLLLLILSLLV
jgi:hypothetical protein